MKYEYRVTKYNPAYRDQDGIYLIQAEWTCYSEIGTKCGNNILNLEDYLKVEEKYIESIVLFMMCLDISYLEVFDLEKDVSYIQELKNDDNITPDMIDLFCDIESGQRLSLKNLKQACQLILRGYLWCKLINDNSMFVHFGYDYYMYIGSRKRCSEAIKSIEDRGLFVEDFESPYLEKDKN